MSARVTTIGRIGCEGLRPQTNAEIERENAEAEAWRECEAALTQAIEALHGLGVPFDAIDEGLKDALVNAWLDADTGDEDAPECSCPPALVARGGFASRCALHGRPRHDHYFEVIEKKELPSAFEESGHTAIGQLLEANKYVNPGWQPNTDVILRLTKHKTLVHYRCNTCGAEKVEKI